MEAYHFSPFAIPAALTAAVVMISAIVIMATRSSRIAIAIFGVAVAAAAWQLARALMLASNDARTAIAWARVSCAFVPLIAAAVYQFAATVCETGTTRKIVSAVAWLLA